MTCYVPLRLANMGVFPSFGYKIEKYDLHLIEAVTFLSIKNVDELNCN